MLGAISFGESTEARLQTLSVFTFSLYLLLPLIVWCWALIVALMLNPATMPAALAYIVYIFVFDSAPVDGSRSAFLRGSGARGTWWRRYCDFFPMTLVKTAELPPTGRYVLGFHPHGIISVGAFGCFATYGVRTLDLSAGETRARTDRRGFDSLYPGVHVWPLTLALNFYIPFVREYLLSLGCCNASRASFRNILAKGAGAGVMIVPGGAEEALLAEPGTISLVLAKRKGFVREAILGGAQLVPCLAFGESDLFEVSRPEAHTLRARAQQLVYRLTGVAMPFFNGRSFFFKEVCARAARPSLNTCSSHTPGTSAHARALGGDGVARARARAGGPHAAAQADRRRGGRAARAGAGRGLDARPLSRAERGGGRAAHALRRRAARALCRAQGRGMEHAQPAAHALARGAQVMRPDSRGQQRGTERPDSCERKGAARHAVWPYAPQ